MDCPKQNRNDKCVEASPSDNPWIMRTELHAALNANAKQDGILMRRSSPSDVMQRRRRTTTSMMTHIDYIILLIFQ